MSTSRNNTNNLAHSQSGQKPQLANTQDAMRKNIASYVKSDLLYCKVTLSQLQRNVNWQENVGSVNLQLLAMRIAGLTEVMRNSINDIEKSGYGIDEFKKLIQDLSLIPGIFSQLVELTLQPEVNSKQPQIKALVEKIKSNELLEKLSFAMDNEQVVKADNAIIDYKKTTMAEISSEITAIKQSRDAYEYKISYKKVDLGGTQCELAGYTCKNGCSCQGIRHTLEEVKHQGDLLPNIKKKIAALEVTNEKNLVSLETEYLNTLSWNIITPLFKSNVKPHDEKRRMANITIDNIAKEEINAKMSALARRLGIFSMKDQCVPISKLALPPTGITVDADVTNPVVLNCKK